MCLFQNRLSLFQSEYQVGVARRTPLHPSHILCTCCTTRFTLSHVFSSDLENVILGEPPSCRLFLDACMKRITGSVDPQAASLTMDWAPLDVDVLWCVLPAHCSSGD